MSPIQQMRMRLSRRSFLSGSATGLGSVVLASLLRPECGAASEKWLGTVNPRHFAPRAKRVIFLYMAGGPSQLESFNYRPRLAVLNGKPMPESYTKPWRRGARSLW